MIMLPSAIRSRRPGSGPGVGGTAAARRSSAPAIWPSQAAALRNLFITAVSDRSATPPAPAQAAAARNDSPPGP
jgi:hypothetical protein